MVTARLSTSEDELISRLFKPLATAAGACALQDDAAVLHVPQGMEAIVSTDTLIADCHYFESDAPSRVAQKSIRVNISDIISKGATPVGFFLNLSLSKTTTEEWLVKFAEGLKSDCKEYNLSLLGGDTTFGIEKTVLSVTMVGVMAQGKIVRRTAAKRGDDILVSGTLGDSGVGLIILKTPEALSRVELAEGEREALKQRYWLPCPPVGLSEIIASHATASMDISDGLLRDADRLSRASGVGMRFYRESCPLSAEVEKLIRFRPELWQLPWIAGDDYQCLLTVRSESSREVIELARAKGIRLTKMGEVTDKQGVEVVGLQGEKHEFDRMGYDHFSDNRLI